jgi:hypothetical protein
MKIKSFSNLFLCLFLTSISNAQNFEWVKNIGGVSSAQGISMDIDQFGNIYTVGNFYGNGDFDPSPNTINLSSAGNSDVFITKMNPSGDIEWIKSIGGSGNDIPYTIKIDNNQQICVSGSFEGTVDFDPGLSVDILNAIGNSDVFILKLDALGNYLWSKSVGGSGVDGGLSMTTDNSGNAYITGYFSGTADFNPGITTFNLTSQGGYNIFILKLDGNGNFIWAKNIGSSGNEEGNSIAIDNNNGYIYTTGYFSGTSDFDPGSGSFFLTSSGGNDIFILKLDLSGNFIWAKKMGGSLNDFGRSIAVDAFGGIISTGYFSGTADFDPSNGFANFTSLGNFDVYISKLDGNGNYNWTKTIGNSENDNGYSISTNNDGDLFITGSFEGIVDFDPDPVSNYMLSSNGIEDVFLLQLNTLGGFVYAGSFGGFGLDFGSCVANDYQGNLYSMGYFEGNIDFDPGLNIYSLSSVGGADVFIHKMGFCNTISSSIAIDACNSYLSPSGNYTWTNSGVYNDTLQTTAGCDSIITIDLTIHFPTTSSQTQSALDSYTWPINGQTYIQSGIYTAVIPNAAGCDSTITLDLTMSFTGIDEQENSKIIISPNPSSDYFMVSASEELIGESYSIIDLNGKTLKEGTLTQKEQKIEIGNLSEGMYLFKIKNKSEQTFRIVKN